MTEHFDLKLKVSVLNNKNNETLLIEDLPGDLVEECLSDGFPWLSDIDPSLEVPSVPGFYEVNVHLEVCLSYEYGHSIVEDFEIKCSDFKKLKLVEE